MSINAQLDDWSAQIRAMAFRSGAARGPTIFGRLLMALHLSRHRESGRLIRRDYRHLVYLPDEETTNIPCKSTAPTSEAS